jgi:hypothetical protein
VSASTSCKTNNQRRLRRQRSRGGDKVIVDKGGDLAEKYINIESLLRQPHPCVGALLEGNPHAQSSGSHQSRIASPGELWKGLANATSWHR